MPRAFINDEEVEMSDGEIEDLSPPPSPVATVPSRITMRQAKLCLHRAGMLPAANAALASMEGGEGIEARLEWEYSTSLERGSSTVAKVAHDLGLPDTQVDDLFIWAATL